MGEDTEDPKANAEEPKNDKEEEIKDEPQSSHSTNGKANNLRDKFDDEHSNADDRRRSKNEARLTTGIGKPKEKIRNLEIFWGNIWPKLEEAGWTKIDGEGAQIGCVTFLPKGSSIDDRDGPATGERYDRIRDVLDRLDEGRSQTEAAIANLYHSLQTGASEKQPTNTVRGTPANRSARHNVLLSPKIDLSWKDGGRNFPRKKSQIGDDYQVSKLPKAGTFESSEHAECIILWDTKKAATLLDEDGNIPILDQVPANKREAALELLAEREYTPGEDFVETVASLPARNGSDWPPEKKAKFSESVFSLRKDLHGVRAAMGIDMATCLAHYYGVFKHTDDYRLVKTVLHDEKLDAKTAAAVATINNAALVASGAAGAAPPPPSVQDGDPDACVICDDGGELLICDGCEREYHLECMDPPLQSVPEGHWECDECVNQKLLAFRDFLVRRSGLFEAKDDEEEAEDDDVPSLIFKPTPDAMATIRIMAEGISKILASPQPEDEAMEDVGTPKGEVSIKIEDSGGSGSGGRRKRKRKSEAALLS
ncbi:hypothetical protein ACA910_002439 [Epithemia clementina (nom. ined.)]